MYMYALNVFQDIDFGVQIKDIHDCTCVCVPQVEGCIESMLEEEWILSAFPDGAHQVNIQRGSKGFGIVLVEQKVTVDVQSTCTCILLHVHRIYITV